MDPRSNVSSIRSPDSRAAEPQGSSRRIATALRCDPDRLRSVLDSDGAAIARVVQAALADSRGGTRRPLPLVGALAAASALAAGLILVLPSWRGMTPEGVNVGRIAISNQGEIVLASRPESSGGWIVSASPELPSQSSQIILVLHGDRP